MKWFGLCLKFFGYDLKVCVSQGFILGPILFTLYIMSILSGYVLQHHNYANDTQLYEPVSPSDFSAFVKKSLKVILMKCRLDGKNQFQLKSDETKSALLDVRKDTKC